MASILVVEDEVPLMRMLSWVLTERGFEVSLVRHADDAGAQLMGGTSPDVVIFNQAHLSIDDKRRYVALFRALDAGLKIIELKSSDEPESEASVDAVLSKPFHADDLIAEIDRQLAGAPQQAQRPT